MPLGWRYRRQPRHLVLDRDPAPQKRGHSPPIFGPSLLWLNGWIDQDATNWYGGRLRSRPRCVRWRPSSPHGKGHSSPSLFGLSLLWLNGWIDQDNTWYGGRPRPRPHCVRWGPSSPKGAQHPPLFGPCLLCASGRPSQQLLSSFCSFETHTLLLFIEKTWPDP